MLCGSGTVSECEDAFIELLNLDSLPDNTKEKLIERNSCKISDIARITHTNMHTHLLIANKYEDLSLAAYSRIMAICPWYYKSLSAYDISAEKMKLLIEERKISLTEENYTGVKEEHPQLLPAFVSVRFSDFIKNDLNLEIMEDDMLSFLDSGKLDSEQKTQLLLAGFAVWKTMTDTGNLAKIGKTMMEIRFSGNCIIPINSIIGSMGNIADKIDILELQHRNMKSEDIVRIVADLGAEYAALIERKGLKPKVEKTLENEKLAKILEATGLISSFAIKENKIEIHQRKK